MLTFEHAADPYQAAHLFLLVFHLVMASTSQRPNKTQAQKRGSSKTGKSSQPLSWARLHKSILRDKVPNWQDTTTSDEEMKVIQDTLHLIEEDHEGLEDGQALPGNLQDVSHCFQSEMDCIDWQLYTKKIRAWFMNYGESSQKKPQKQVKAKKHKKSYSVRDVVPHQYPDRITETTSKLSKGAARGSGPWLKHYPQAVSSVIDQLTHREHDEIDTLVDQWNSVGPPDAYKAQYDYYCSLLDLSTDDLFFRTADKKLGQKVNDFIKEVQRTMGVQMFVVAGYRRPNGELTKVS